MRCARGCRVADKANSRLRVHKSKRCPSNSEPVEGWTRRGQSLLGCTRADLKWGDGFEDRMMLHGRRIWMRWRATCGGWGELACGIEDTVELLPCAALTAATNNSAGQGIVSSPPAARTAKHSLTPPKSPATARHRPAKMTTSSRQLEVGKRQQRHHSLALHWQFGQGAGELLFVINSHFMIRAKAVYCLDQNSW